MGKRRKSRQNSTSSSTSKPDAKLDVRLATIILAKGFVSSPEEATCLAESIVAEVEESELSREQACIASFEDYFSLSRSDAATVLSGVLNIQTDNDSSDDDSSLESSKTGGLKKDEEDEVESDDDDGLFIGKGECELCERYIRLTKHHLIPRSTWPKIIPRCLNAAEALSKNDVHRAGLILGPGLHHLLEPLARTGVDKTAVKAMMQTTTNICGPCHGAVHRTHDNMSLANNFSTVELLLKDEEIFKFCKWASKQRAGKHAV